jgi:hypothetical protein
MPNTDDFYGARYDNQLELEPIALRRAGIDANYISPIAPKKAGITAPAYTPSAPYMPPPPAAPAASTTTPAPMSPSQAAKIGGAFDAIPLIGSVANAIQIGRDLKKLKRRGQLDVTPQAFRDAIQAQRGLAASTQIPGYSQALDNMNANAQATMGNVNRTVQSGAQALAAATRVGQNQTQNLNRLAMQGMQNQQAQQGRLTSMLGQQGQYQEQGRQEFNRDVAALTGAKRQQWFDAAKGAAMVGATIATGGLAGAGAAGAGAAGAGAAGAGAAGGLSPAMLKMLLGG